MTNQVSWSGAVGGRGGLVGRRADSLGARRQREEGQELLSRIWTARQLSRRMVKSVSQAKHRCPAPLCSCFLEGNQVLPMVLLTYLQGRPRAPGPPAAPGLGRFVAANQGQLQLGDLPQQRFEPAMFLDRDRRKIAPPAPADPRLNPTRPPLYPTTQVRQELVRQGWALPLENPVLTATRCLAAFAPSGPARYDRCCDLCGSPQCAGVGGRPRASEAARLAAVTATTG